MTLPLARTAVRRLPTLWVVALILTTFLGQVPVAAQDSLQASPLTRTHSPSRASLYSAILPGMGQAYNRKYWKVPVIYTGFATLGYFISMNTSEYRKFREAYNYVSSGDSTGAPNEYVSKYTSAGLLQGREYYRRNMELSYILTGVLYILNVVDAAVDAHLWDFDVGEDLSLQVRPTLYPLGPRYPMGGGLSLQLSFR